MENKPEYRCDVYMCVANTLNVFVLPIKKPQMYLTLGAGRPVATGCFRKQYP